jgi:hypothetical protein
LVLGSWLLVLGSWFLVQKLGLKSPLAPSLIGEGWGEVWGFGGLVLALMSLDLLLVDAKLAITKLSNISLNL